MCQIEVNACNLYRGNTCCFREVQQPQEKTYRCYHLVATRPPLPLILPPLHPFQIIRTVIKKRESRGNALFHQQTGYVIQLYSFHKAVFTDELQIILRYQFGFGF